MLAAAHLLLLRCPKTNVPPYFPFGIKNKLLRTYSYSRNFAFSSSRGRRIGSLPVKHSILRLCRSNNILCVRSCPLSTSRKLPKLHVGRILQLAKPEKWKLSIAIVLLLISSTVTLAVPYCLGQVINIIYNMPKDEMKSKLTKVCRFLILLFIVGGLANFGRVYLINLTGQKIVNRVRTMVFSSIMKQEISFFDVNKTGELINRLSSDSTVVGHSLTQNISDGLRSAFAILSGVGMMVYVSPELSLVGLVIVPPVAVIAVIYGRYLRYISQSLQDSLASAAQVSEESITNIRTVRSFAREKQMYDDYAGKISFVMKLARKESLARGIFYGSSGLSGNLVVLSVLYYGGIMMTEAQITVGDLTSFLMYAAYVGISIGGISSFYSELMRGLGASERLWELVDRKPTIPLTGGHTFPSLKGNIIFDDVTFSYPNRPDVNILRNFTLSIPHGSVQAIVGPSGSGKSTLGSLLLRFYDVNSGSVLIDGNDIKDLDTSWLRNQIGSVSQDPVLFSCSIRDNVVFGLSDSSNAIEEKVVHSLKEANAWEFIKQFPQGLNTIVGERGVMLSGGQKQRIALARAIIKDPKILLLDEATSALDAESEFLIKEALERIMKNRTVVVIAHRLSTVTGADRIAVLDGGRIVESGNFDELMRIPDGYFRKLIEKQSRIKET
ncbi:ATP-binding cassette sub-family B member 10, mitochondrial-like [Centruroides vittatus]|uniref:ATP-binding cassette sub-family B member 10, mitochondrial-like n=1 Tax=Centruroides vittatus TaxID=120091 RepID=UPI00350FD35D